MNYKNIAIIYDDLYQKGGGENLYLFIVNKIFPKSVLYVPIVAKDFREDVTISTRLYYSKVLTFIAEKFGKYGYYLASLLSVFWFESLDFSKYGLVISLSNRFSHCVITQPDTKHISIITSPFRILWEKNEFNNFIIPHFLKFLRFHNYNSARRADKLIAISSYVQNKIRKRWHLNSVVLNPPLIKFQSSMSQKKTIDLRLQERVTLENVQNKYFLVVGRLNTWKSPYFEKVFRIFQENQSSNFYLLKVIGDGPFMKKFITRYRRIEFLGRVSSKEMSYVYRGAIALIHPQVEDFGLTPLESLYHGVPVIAYKKGGVLDYLNSKVCLFYKSDAELLRSINMAKEFRLDTDEVQRILNVHSEENFGYNLKKLIQNT